ncbi:DDB1- and CUL4-associated factor 15-like isoform X2 [Gracilinanus agilis]|uniref:DDB1- and CUL4-associated factor 15-like isoform X2 n=1 Tax=Gracilinanus agilis TaxID=191870 RepID=UPI001CFD0665|nr:DDB1- and CUL4-associated factor 15-like isoform X2 [Gracilinanus agilis]
MAPSSKTGRKSQAGGSSGGGGGGQGGNPARTQRRGHIIKQLDHARVSGQLSSRLFRKLPPRVCVSLRSIVDEDYLSAGHIFLGFSKCGRYVFSYTNSSGDDDFFYIYHLYWWEFNIHSKLKLVRQVRLFQEEEIYSDLYLTVCEWPSDSNKIIIFGSNTQSTSGLLLNMMTTNEENQRDIYVSIVATPPGDRCLSCQDARLAHFGDPSVHCLKHGFMLHTKYQVVYPFPTFQPAFQLKKDQVALLNTSYSLVACAFTVCSAGDDSFHQLLYDGTTQTPPPPDCSGSLSLGDSLLSRESRSGASSLSLRVPSAAVAKAEEFEAISWGAKEEEGGIVEEAQQPPCLELQPPPYLEVQKPPCLEASEAPPLDEESEFQDSPIETVPPVVEPDFINYTKLHYVLEPGNWAEPEDEVEDDKISLPFVVTDLQGRNLRPMRDPPVCQGQYLTVEQLILDFEYVINEVIRNDASWSQQFDSFSDYDIVILQVCPETNKVLINIGLLLLAFPLPSGEVQGQTTSSIWSSYRKNCADLMMKWLVPENDKHYVNRITNEAQLKGGTVKALADKERYTWIVL